ncbi:DUF2281 domain-containing protein [Cyanobacterium aponinum AL20118]|uniref:DUF2281 domain-containing protein n=1 Tax=Cyanobacterium aponinum AL20115 TaxID=3090662 RepID=A0AAF0ZDQ8_9CHRO|nr:DUF2281 domain-containing protein [Cyanobacterium aponinum]WPF88137.1 DUF2281 domain-containing protein [Cyanobacterium aponinum AL20115]
MSIKEQLIQEIEQTPEHLISELLDFLLFIKQRYNCEDEITEQEKINIAISLQDYQAGDYISLEEYEEKQP